MSTLVLHAESVNGGPARPHGCTGRARAAGLVNLAGALGTVWTTLIGPGPAGILLTLFLQEGLHAEKWQIGLLLTMTFLGPTIEPLGAYLIERWRCRKSLFIVTFLLFRVAFFGLALVPLMAPVGGDCRQSVVFVLLLVTLTRLPAHLGAPAWWSWIADLIPERCRGRFFGCRSQWSSALTALSFVGGMGLLHIYGGMENRVLISSIFAVAACFGVVDIVLFFFVPDPGSSRPHTDAGGRTFITGVLRPFQQPGFRQLLLGMGLWSFSTNLLLPFVPLYQRGEVVNGQSIGLGVSWLMLALLTVVSNVAAIATSRFWGRCCDRIRLRQLLPFASSYLFVNLGYLVISSQNALLLLVPMSLLGGALNACWTVATQQLMLRSTPRQDRGYFISTYNLVNGWLMAGGPLLGGWLADQCPLLGWTLPGGLPCCYVHLLLIVSMLGGLAALAVLVTLPETMAKEEIHAQFQGWRVKLPTRPIAVDRAELNQSSRPLRRAA